MAVRDTPVRLDGAEIIAQDLAKMVSAQTLGNHSIKLTTSTEGNSSAERSSDQLVFYFTESR